MIKTRDILLTVDRDRRKAITRQIQDQLREAIRSERLTLGSALPSTRALAEDLGVSRGVILRAYEQLAAEGYIIVRPGACPRVRGPAGDSGAQPHEIRDRPLKCRFDLRPDMPDVSTFPRSAWLRSECRALGAASIAEIGYCDSRGLDSLRYELRAYLGRARGVVTGVGQLIITGGSTHSLSLIARTLAREPLKTIAFENPSHALHHAVVRGAGLEPVGVPVDAEGIVVSELAKLRVAAVVVGAAHQFPTGCALSEARRAELVSWAQATGALIIEDEYDAEFRYDRPPAGAMQQLAPENVVYLGSASKTLAPGLRLGWAVVPPSLEAAIAEEMRTTVIHLSTLTQLAFVDFLRAGEFDRHLRKMRKIYRRRRDVLVEALHAELPLATVSGVAAGLHVLVAMPHELANMSRERALGRGIAFDLISDHALPGLKGSDGLILGYGRISEATIPLAISELAGVLAHARAPEMERKCA